MQVPKPDSNQPNPRKKSPFIPILIFLLLVAFAGMTILTLLFLRGRAERRELRQEIQERRTEVSDIEDSYKEQFEELEKMRELDEMEEANSEEEEDEDVETEEEVVRSENQITMLRSYQLENPVDYCTEFYPIAEEEYRSFAGITADGLSSEAVREEIMKVLPDPDSFDEFIKKLTPRIEDYSVNAICDIEGRIFVPTLSANILVLLEWDSAKESFITYQPISDIMDGYFQLFTYGTEVVAMNGYGDAGHMWWGYYFLDARTGSVDLVEKCHDAPKIDEETQDIVNEERVITCEREYIPEQQ